ncbi:YigZ family protein [bacterium]|nr:YigZ family protein [bacterium]
MMRDDSFFTLQDDVTFEMKVRDSRFIGHAAPIGDLQESESVIRKIRKEHHDAAHHAFAYRLGTGADSRYRSSDAGEPSGTAGKPILDAMDGRSLTDVVCVVTRYFGGTKLGTGGLIRAYGGCAAGTLDRGTTVVKYRTGRFRIAFGYEWTGAVMQVIRRFESEILNTAYGGRTEMSLRIRLSRLEPFQQALRDGTSGQVRMMGEDKDDL